MRNTLRAVVTGVCLLSSTHSQFNGTCASSLDCSLNGECVSNVCVCDPWWSGSPACDVLVLLPARRDEGYRNSSNVTSWGGMSVRDDAGAWHLFAAEMVGRCGLSSWKTNSRVIRGVGAAPGGPFSIEQQIAAPFAHNPKVARAPDGTWVLFSIGSGLWNTTPSACAAGAAGAAAVGDGDYPGPGRDGCGGGAGENGGCGVSIGSAPSPSGPWTFVPLIVENQNASALLDCAHTNPSVAFLPNGSVVMAVNAGWCHDHLETIGLLTAPSWRGPFTFLSTDPILHNADGSIHHGEDPFIYADARGFHLLIHNMQGAGVALYAHSADAFTWVLHDGEGNPGPYTGVIEWADGAVDNFDVERPQFVFDPDTGKPLYLTNGAEGRPTSFTLFRPLAQVPPPPPPPPARLVSAGGCLTTAGAPPCWANPAGYWICPLAVSNASCSSDAALWTIAGGVILSAASGAGARAPVNIDCDACASGTVLKLISSGSSALAYNATSREIRAGSCSAPPMCVTNGVAAGATRPCGGGAEPWTPTQPHLAPCGASADTVWDLA